MGSQVVGEVAGETTEEKEFRPSCVNCRRFNPRECVIAKNLRDYKGHIQTIGLHCMDWEGEVHGMSGM
jgi:hypothetical protein